MVGTMGRVSISDDFIDQLSAVIHQNEGNQWLIGDMLVEYWNEAEKYYTAEGRSRESYFREVSERTGTHTGTLRSCYRVSSLCTKDKRRRYDMFTYYQIRSATSAGDRWQYYLLWALAYADVHGRLPSGDTIREKIAGGKKTDEEKVVKSLATIVKHAELVTEIHPSLYVSMRWVKAAVGMAREKMVQEKDNA